MDNIQQNYGCVLTKVRVKRIGGRQKAGESAPMPGTTVHTTRQITTPAELSQNILGTNAPSRATFDKKITKRLAIDDVSVGTTPPPPESGRLTV